MPHIRRALISVSDKRGLVEFAQALQALNVEIISTGGTHTLLSTNGIRTRSVSEVTEFPEILDGRVKTLHPKIHGALLAVADNDSHTQQLREHHIQAIDMVVVNLYPFEQTIARNGVPLDEAVEQIDIGGPAMIRSAAKNFKHKAVIVNPDRYPAVAEELRSNGGRISDTTCFTLAREVFRHTSSYDAAISRYLDRAQKKENCLPDLLHISMRRETNLRYGENPHQRASVYGNFGSLFQTLHGKELSYNNIVDIAAAAKLVAEFDEPTVAIIKHTNPCGVGSGTTLLEAYTKALATDSKSAFGGIVAMNRPLDRDAAEKMNEIFTEVIIAPGFPDSVLEFLKKKKDRRLIRIAVDLRALDELEIRSIPGGFLVQDSDKGRLTKDGFKVVTKRKPTDEETRAALYAWRVAKHVKSNAIVYARPDRTIGVGAGQMSRVDSARVAAQKAVEAGLVVKDTAVASDAFFPFADGLLEAVKAGSTAVIQPGGSIRDEEVIHAADENNIAMVFTGIRHFKH
ncbi:MAG TPA: bifunctional phosphoribosylaminoimidazolecarboxamide formyltransferase/inosine monophosphate cyclohydrolase [Bacteroidetes bacterium]|nr:bifunctional phosphoribosylaminoimidazolecarboxamide formyltransferase/inosine monophosphate cyclohydrolase [Bacteroidota bacterium]